jgi:hypothetical protein
MTNDLFTGFSLVNGLLFDGSFDEFPTRLYSWNRDGADTFELERHGSTFYVFVHNGKADVQTNEYNFYATEGMYFSCRNQLRIDGGCGLIVESVGYNGTFILGGPVEEKGRLKYIDGCTDSLLIPPIRFGDPCFNALYFPPGTNQTQHTHPSIRIGLVFKGDGECLTPKGKKSLTPGMAFIIHPNALHSFHTPCESELVVVAYHPESDFGPQDTNHPMINKTIVGGVSAQKIDAIMTK